MGVAASLVQENGGETTEAANGAISKLLQTFGLLPAYADTVADVIVFVVAFVALYFLGRAVVVPLIRRALRSRGYDRSVTKPVMKIVRIVSVFAAIAVAFTFAGFGSFLTAFATIGAAATLAVGFALQDVIANFVAGVFIFTDKPFRIDDWIEWDDGTYSGIVEDISLRVTRVRSFDNELLTVPNSVLTDGVIKNPVAKDKLRQKFVFGIGYDDDIQAATDIIVDEAEKHPGIMDDPATTVRLTELADSYVGLQSRFWIDDPSRSDFVRVRGEYVTAVKKRFDDAGIDIPFPIRTLDGGIEISNGPEIAQVGDD